MKNKGIICTILSMFLVIFFTCLKGQEKKTKPLIDTAVINNWAEVTEPAICNNGKYICYLVNEGYGRRQSLFIKSVDEKWKKEVKNIESYSFTHIGDQVVCMLSDGGLKVCTLGTSLVEDISGSATAFHLFSIDDKEYLFFFDKEKNTNLIIRELKTKNEKIFNNVTNYWLSENHRTIVLQRSLHDEMALYWVNVPGFTEKEICKHKLFESVIIDRQGNKLAYITKNEESLESNVVWLYIKGNENPVKIVTDLRRRKLNLIIDKLDRFSLDGNRIFIYTKGVAEFKPKNDGVMVDIWSYKDTKLQSQQLKNLKDERLLSTLNLENKQILKLQSENETVKFFDKNDSIAEVTYLVGDLSEGYWNPVGKRTHYILNCQTGERKQVPIYLESISPNGKYLIGRNDSFDDVVSYSLVTNRINQITKDLPIPERGLLDLPGRERRSVKFAGWLGNEAIVLAYDDYDIWKIDLLQPERAVNLTNGYGRKNNIIFRLAFPTYNGPLKPEDASLLLAFNILSKENGFFRGSLSMTIDPLKLSMGSFYYSIPDYPSYNFFKAKKANVWLVGREQSNNGPNYYTTKDFISFNKISDVHPEININWLTTELINYNSQDGKPSQGVLYKPENFNPKNKYPLIITYYEKLSNRLNTFLRPDLASDRINIPWFVSRGYLVFTPDINYEIGDPGKSALNSILGAVNYFNNYSYVDLAKVGLQGHSFGGYETNYIISHSNKFAAAIASSSFCDLISASGSITSGGVPFFRYWAENGQGRIGYKLWDTPELYIKNSPIFNANMINTPLLLMNNRQDGVVNFEQGVELFTALRRLGKKVWMLQYDNEDHSLSNKMAAFDYTKRMDQFFDHYLKGMFAPVWMTKGIEAKYKGLKAGLELDTDIIESPGHSIGNK